MHAFLYMCTILSLILHLGTELLNYRVCISLKRKLQHLLSFKILTFTSSYFPISLPLHSKTSLRNCLHILPLFFISHSLFLILTCSYLISACFSFISSHSFLFIFGTYKTTYWSRSQDKSEISGTSLKLFPN